MATATARHHAEDTCEYWLVVLLRALRQSDLELAAEAQRELKRLGLDVRPCSLLRRSAGKANRK